LFRKIILPVAMIAAIMAGDVFAGGAAAPATAPALTACCVRLAPVLSRAAVSLGASEAYQATYQGVRTYFNKADGRSSSGAGKSGRSGPAPKKPELPKRAEPAGENGSFWKSLVPKTKDEAAKLASYQRKALNKQDEIRFDGKYYYQFDRFHKGKFGEHIHRYVTKGKNVRLDAEIDPQTGEVIKLIKEGTIPESWF
jgi:hypothetical protein